jgi:hypothetical protein
VYFSAHVVILFFPSVIIGTWFGDP